VFSFLIFYRIFTELWVANSNLIEKIGQKYDQRSEATRGVRGSGLGGNGVPKAFLKIKRAFVTLDINN